MKRLSPAEKGRIINILRRYGMLEKNICFALAEIEKRKRPYAHASLAKLAGFSALQHKSMVKVERIKSILAGGGTITDAARQLKANPSSLYKFCVQNGIDIKAPEYVKARRLIQQANLAGKVADFVDLHGRQALRKSEMYRLGYKELYDRASEDRPFAEWQKLHNTIPVRHVRKRGYLLRKP